MLTDLTMTFIVKNNFSKADFLASSGLTNFCCKIDKKINYRVRQKFLQLGVVCILALGKACH
jgi:hypothetical protein